MNAPQTLWVVVDKDGRDRFSSPHVALAEEWNRAYPKSAPHRVVAYVPSEGEIYDGLVRDAMRWRKLTGDGAMAAFMSAFMDDPNTAMGEGTMSVADALAAADNAAAVPQGASVPREPTSDMLYAANKTNTRKSEARDIWKAMYDAAPREPVKPEYRDFRAPYDAAQEDKA